MKIQGLGPFLWYNGRKSKVVGDNMLTSNDQIQGSFEFVYIEELVPQNHLFRRINKHQDLVKVGINKTISLNAN